MQPPPSDDERQNTEAELQRQYLRSRLFSEITVKIRQSLQLETILQTTVTEVQQLLQADRVLLFQLTPDGTGKVVQEAVVAEDLALLGQVIVDPCFQESYLEQYRQGRIGAVTNIAQSNVTPCYVEFLQQFSVQANLVVPILVRQFLWGLLIAHQCTQPREWTGFETELLQQLADQIGIALSQAQLLEQEVQRRQELARSQQELRLMSAALESAVEGISQLDTQGRYIQVNPAYARMVGYSAEELIGSAWQQTVHPDDLELMQAAYQRMLNTGKVEIEARAIRKDGSVFDEQLVMVKACDPQQQFIGHYCFMKDISDRREVERLKDEFVSIVSHELRTPLTSISGALDLLAHGVLQSQPEEAQRMLNIAASSTDRLVRLINDILDIERIESGKIKITQQTCNIVELILQSVEGIQELAERAGISLVVSPLSLQISADPDRIIQVLTNLLSNAIKFSPAAGTVWLTAEVRHGGAEGRRAGNGEQRMESGISPPPPPHLLISVKDQGRGIPVDKLEAIFERFQQVDASDSRQKGGTGLGLAICRTILHHHGGRIWAESTPGQGSTFYFTLPILPAPETAEQPVWSAAYPHPPALGLNPAQAPLVLVCDDDPDLGTILQNMLERQGYRVVNVTCGVEAVNQATEQSPNAILLNLNMPEIDGWETLARLKQQPETQQIPVIILSGLFPDARELSHPEVSDWLVKPANPRLLSQALERALAKQRHVIRVLVVEDDLELAQVLLSIFSRHGIQAFHTPTGQGAIQLSQRILPDLLVLDLGLPERNGFAVVDWLRQHNYLYQVPLVIYTAWDLNESDREYLKLGQTLFLTKARVTPQEFERQVINLLNRVTCNLSGECTDGG
jgi:PAS domain S-box-containing protein